LLKVGVWQDLGCCLAIAVNIKALRATLVVHRFPEDMETLGNRPTGIVPPACLSV